MIRRAVKQGGCVAVIGCFSQLDPTLNGIEGVSFVGGSKDKSAVFREANQLLENKQKFIQQDFNLTGCIYEKMSIGTEQTTLFSTCRVFIKIEDGCDGKCSYCIIPKTRGPVRSRPFVEIIGEAERVAHHGYKEIVLTGIETSAYDAAPLSALIQQIDRVDGIERLRFGSLSPNTMNDDFLKAAAASPKFMPHIHLSLQSASDRILRLMRRPYNKKQMRTKIENIYKAIPHCLISVDLIVGFPTETEDDFQQTMDFVHEYKLSHVHAFPFSPRPGTEAASMAGRIPQQEVKKRNEQLIQCSQEVKKQIFEQKQGLKVKVLVETISGNTYQGHTEDFLETKFTSTIQYQVGDVVTVNILSSDNTILFGKTELEGDTTYK